MKIRIRSESKQSTNKIQTETKQILNRIQIESKHNPNRILDINSTNHHMKLIQLLLYQQF